MQLHILTFIEQCSGLQGRRCCLAAGVLDIWQGKDPRDPGTAGDIHVLMGILMKELKPNRRMLGWGGKDYSAISITMANLSHGKNDLLLIAKMRM